MPKRNKRNSSRHLTKGGEIIGTAPSQTFDNKPSAFSAWFNEAKKATESAINSASLAASSAANSATSAFNQTVNPSPPPTGGKRRRKGGNLSSTASPISGILSAMPQVWVGGKTRKRRYHKHSKSCKGKTYKKETRKKRAKTTKFSFSNSLKRLIKL